MIRCYSELLELTTFEERFNYLKLDASVGVETFGYDRYLNQMFYRSTEWRQFRNQIIVRDNGFDLGVDGFPIYGKNQLLIHHMNPITKQQVIDRDPSLMDPEFVILTKRNPTHQAIHYGDDSIIKNLAVVDRTPNDTCPWRR